MSWFKRLGKVVVGDVVVTQLSLADEISDLQGHFLQKIDEVVLIVKNKTIDKNERNSDIVKAVTPMFDFELMAKLSLGETWKELQKSDQDKFVKLYVERMKQSYSSKIDAYKDEKIKITSVDNLPNNRLAFNTELVGKADKLKVVYKFHKPKEHKASKDEWLIYDVEISGVSILKTDKAQFKEFLKTKSIQELMETIAKKS